MERTTERLTRACSLERCRKFGRGLSIVGRAVVSLLCEMHVTQVGAREIHQRGGERDDSMNADYQEGREDRLVDAVRAGITDAPKELISWCCSDSPDSRFLIPVFYHRHPAATDVRMTARLARDMAVES